MKRFILFSCFFILISNLQSQTVFVPDEGTYFLKKEGKFFLYDNGQTMSGLTTSWAGKSLLVYSPSNDESYVLKEYEAAIDTTLHPAEKLKKTDQFFWRTNTKSYWIYHKGKELSGFRSFWMDKHLVVYDTIRNFNFILTDYKTAAPDAINPVAVQNLPDGFAYYTNGPSYWLYKKGTFIPTAASFWSNNDLIVYDSINKTTYRFPDYEHAEKFKLYQPTTIFPGEEFLWLRKETLFWLYNKGRSLENVQSFWIGNHLGVYHALTNTTYQFNDYATAETGKVYPAKKINETENTFWWKEKDLYYIAEKGIPLNLEKSNAFWYNDDIIVYSPENSTTYQLAGYKSNPALNLYPPIILGVLQTAMWWQVDGKYFLYDKGIYVNDIESNWENDDLIVKDKLTGKIYVLEDYDNANDGKLRMALIRN